ncbi:MAG: hypothetical protein HY270_15365 [Deltaproteobacteria bacterium]|nr:hypothetical protein [Deltaproteobacteria bacterium]
MHLTNRARGVARFFGSAAIVAGLLIVTLAGLVFVRGLGSFEAGLADLVKVGFQWAFDFRGPLLTFWGRPLLWVEASATHAFAGGAFEVLVFDLKAGGSLTPIARVPVGGFVHDMALRGDVLYVCAGDGGLVVIDVADRAHPALLATLRTFGYTFGAAFSGNRLYVTERTKGVRVFDISDPRRPHQITSYLGVRWANNVAVSEDGAHVYVTDAQRGLIVLDAAATGELTERASLTLPPALDSRPFEPIDPPPLSIRVRGSFVYMASVDRDLVVAEVSDPSAPRVVAQLSLPGETMDVRLHGNRAYLAQEPDGVAIVDITDPVALRLVRTLALPGCAHSIAFSNDRAVVGLLGQGIALLDVSEMDSPRLESQYVPDAEARNVQLAGGFAYVARGSGGLEIYDIQAAGPPRLVSHAGTRDYAYDVSVDASRAYVAEGQLGLRVLDVTDATAPRDLLTVDTPERALAVSMGKTRVYTAEGMYGYSAVDPLAAHIVATGPKDGYAFTVQAMDNMLAVADFFGGLRLLDVSQAEPRLLWKGPRRVMSLAPAGTLMYLVTYGGTFEVVDVADPVSPVVRAHLSLPGRAFGLAVRDGLAAVAAADSGVWLVDVQDADAPRLLASTRTRDRAWGVALADGQLYVADGRAGLSVVDITNRQQPTVESQ